MIGQVLHWAFLATLPVAILLIVNGNPVAGIIVFLVGAPLLWKLRNRARFRESQDYLEMLTEDVLRDDAQEVLDQMAQPSELMRDPHIAGERPGLLPPDDEFVAEFGEPGERFWEGLATVNWVRYLESIHRSDRVRAIEESQQLLVLSSKRLFVLAASPQIVVEFPLDQIGEIQVVVPPGTMGSTQEAMIHLRVQRESGWKEFGWTTKRAAAHGFVEQLRENIAELARARISRDRPFPSE